MADLSRGKTVGKVDFDGMDASPGEASFVKPAWNLRGLSIVAFAHGVSDFYSGVVPFVIFFVITRGHLSPVYQGVLGFIWYLTSSIVQPAFGAYSDRKGRWWFLPAAVGLTAACVSLAGATNSLPLLALCIVGGGLGSAVMHPEAGKYSAMLSGSRKAGGISIFQMGGQIGFALGPAVVALVLVHYGGGGTLLLLLPGALAVAGLFAAMPRIDREATGAHRASAAAWPAPTAVDRVGVSLLVTSTALRHFTSAAFVTFLPNLLIARGASIPLAGQIVSGFLLISTVGLVSGGYLGDRFGAVRISVVSLVAAVPLLFAFVALQGPLAIALLFAASVLLAVQNAPGVAIVQAMLPRNLGMALGLMNGVAFGVGSAGVAGVGIVVARLGATAALETVSAIPLVSALAYVFVRDRIPSASPAHPPAVTPGSPAG